MKEMKYKNLMKEDTIYKQILLYGFLASVFFSSTFAINKFLNIDTDGHWFWTAALRYIYVFVLLNIIIIIRNNLDSLKKTYSCFFNNFLFWLLAGGIGFGVFYMCLCYAASYSDGWVLASSWQTTILFTPLVLYIFGEKVNKKGILHLFFMFVGVIFINSYAFDSFNLKLANSIIPILLASFAYPFGNTLCKYASQGRYKNLSVSNFKVSRKPINQILLMVLGALPLIGFTGFIVQPKAPTEEQLSYIVIVALLSGVIATYFLFKARNLAKKDPNALAFADGTQALESPLALFWGYFCFKETFPNYIGLIGLMLLTISMYMYYTDSIKNKSNSLKN